MPFNKMPDYLKILPPDVIYNMLLCDHDLYKQFVHLSKSNESVKKAIDIYKKSELIHTIPTNKQNRDEILKCMNEYKSILLNYGYYGISSVHIPSTSHNIRMMEEYYKPNGKYTDLIDILKYFDLTAIKFEEYWNSRGVDLKLSNRTVYEDSLAGYDMNLYLNSIELLFFPIKSTINSPENLKNIYLDDPDSLKKAWAVSVCTNIHCTSLRDLRYYQNGQLSSYLVMIQQYFTDDIKNNIVNTVNKQLHLENYEGIILPGMIFPKTIRSVIIEIPDTEHLKLMYRSEDQSIESLKPTIESLHENLEHLHIRGTVNKENLKALRKLSKFKKLKSIKVNNTSHPDVVEHLCKTRK